MLRPGGMFLQANFGGLGSREYVKQMQLSALTEVGFVDVIELETLSSDEQSDDRLVFITTRGNKRMSLEEVGSKIPAKRQIIWESGDSIGYFGRVALPQSIPEAR